VAPLRPSRCLAGESCRVDLLRIDSAGLPAGGAGAPSSFAQRRNATALHARQETLDDPRRHVCLMAKKLNRGVPIRAKLDAFEL
jgi:hypothetical protein